MRIHTPQSSSGSSKYCCRWSWINKDIARLVLLFSAILLYMMFGAVVFSALERPSEIKALKKWDKKFTEFAQKHQVNQGELHMLLKDYERANAAGIWVQAQRTQWDFSGAFCFVATVVSTIGYGLTAPATTDGKVFLIFFGLIGCAGAILFYNLFLERAITLLAYVLQRGHKWNRGSKSDTSHLNTQQGYSLGRQKSWKPSVYHLAIIFLLICFLVAFGASGLYTIVEGWDYLESMYFCFVTFSTMGFGDMVSGLKERYESSWFYKIANSLALFLGVCCTYSLLNLNSVIIKQILNWLLDKIMCLSCCPQTGLKHFCCSCLMCTKDPDLQSEQNTASHFGQHWSCNMKMTSLSSLGREKSSGACSALQTVYQSEIEKNVRIEHVSDKTVNGNHHHLCNHHKSLSDMMVYSHAKKLQLVE